MSNAGWSVWVSQDGRLELLQGEAGAPSLTFVAWTAGTKRDGLQLLKDMREEGRGR